MSSVEARGVAEEYDTADGGRGSVEVLRIGRYGPPSGASVTVAEYQRESPWWLRPRARRAVRTVGIVAQMPMGGAGQLDDQERADQRFDQLVAQAEELLELAVECTLD